MGAVALVVAWPSLAWRFRVLARATMAASVVCSAQVRAPPLLSHLLYFVFLLWMHWHPLIWCTGVASTPAVVLLLLCCALGYPMPWLELLLLAMLCYCCSSCCYCGAHVCVVIS
jgi:hypothetical protein